MRQKLNIDIGQLKNAFRFSNLFLILVGLLYSQSVRGQNCYIRLDDASGVNTDAYQTQLEAAACELIQSFPVEYQDSFKVFDFGFYLHQEVYEGGYPEAMNTMIEQVEGLSPYYLLFGKQTDQSGVYSKIWVELILPSAEISSCYNQDEVESRAVFGVATNENEPYPIPIISSINEATRIINKMIFCCEEDFLRNEYTCPICSDDLDFYMNQLNVYQYVEIQDVNVTGSGDPNFPFNVEFSNDVGQSFNLTDELIDFSFDLDIYGYQNTIKQLVLDLDLCLDIVNNNWEEIKNSNSNFLGGNHYVERVVIIKVNNEYKVFYRFEVDPLLTIAFVSESERLRSSNVIVPIIVRWIVKRAVMAGTGVLMEITVSILFERAFGEHDTWSQAWDSTDLKGWALFWAAVEGANSKKILEASLSIMGACVTSGLNYIENNKATFALDELFEQSFYGCLFGAAAYIGGNFAAKGFKAARKYWPTVNKTRFGKLLPKFIINFKNYTGFRLLVRKAGLSVDDDVILALGKDLKASVELDNYLRNVDLDGGGVKAWKDLFDFPNLRIKTNHLEAYDVFKTSNNVTPKVTKDEIIEVLEELGSEADQIKYLEHLDEFNKGNRQWGHVDYEGGTFNGNSQATFFDVRVSYQANRPQVGVAFSENGILEMHLLIPSNLQQQKLGTNIFKRAIIDYNPSKVKGNWKTANVYDGGESINLTIYKQKLAEGFTPQAAAFETPTGKILQQNGFGGTPTIITNTADEVVVHFNPG